MAGMNPKGGARRMMGAAGGAPSVGSGPLGGIGQPPQGKAKAKGGPQGAHQGGASRGSSRMEPSHAHMMKKQERGSGKSLKGS